jgi:hypothetical protein
MRDLQEDFEVEPGHLVLLCDAVLSGELPDIALADIGCALVASDHFQWDTDTPAGSRVADTLFEWSTPEINYALTPQAVAKFRHRLLTGEDQFTSQDPPGRSRRPTVMYRPGN